MQRRQHLGAFLQQQRLGDLELEPPRRQAGMFQRIRHHREQIAAAELERRQVHGDTDVVRPGRGIEAGAAQHQAAQRIDQAGFLGNRNELGRRDHTTLGMRPAHQRLEAGDAAALEIDQRLVVGAEHVVLDRVAQLDLDLAAALSFCMERGLEEGEAAARIQLGARQRHVGALEQLFGLIAVTGRHRDADRGADHHGMAVEQIGIGNGLEQAFCEAHRVLGARQPILDNSELVRIEPRQRVFVAQGRAQPLGDAAQELVADRMSQRVVDRLEIVEPEHQHRDLLGAAPRMLQHLVHGLTQQIAVRQAGQPVMLGHEGKPRLGALALGDVHQREQHRGPLVIGQFARIDREIDQRAVGLDVLPGPRRLLLAGAVGGPGRLAVESLQGADLQLLELGAAIAVMRDRGVVDAENALVVERADDHGDRVAVEQQAERGLALLQFGDVDAQADDAAVIGAALLDQDDAAIRQRLLVALAGLMQLLQPRGDPFVLVAGRFRIVAAGDADAQRIFEARALRKQIGGLAVDLGILLVPENVAAFGIEDHDALRQQVDRLAQPLMRFARFGDGGFGFRTALHELVAFGGRMRRARKSRLARLSAASSKHVALSLFCFFGPQTQLHTS